jgi:hypothetical protein
MLSNLIKKAVKVSIQTKDAVMEKGPAVAGNLASRTKTAYDAKMVEYKEAAKLGVKEARR